MGDGVSGQDIARAPSLSGADLRRSSVVQAVTLASEELTADDLASLQDPSFRSQAARWRAGTGSRKVAAIFARMLNALKNIKPAWVSDQAVPEMPIVEPLPLQPGHQPIRTKLQVMRMMFESMNQVLRRYWWTMWLILVLLFFPKLLAAMVAFVIRLLMRVVASMVMRVVREVFFEMEGLISHLSNLTTGMEQYLVMQLELWMHPWMAPTTSFPPSSPTMDVQHQESVHTPQPTAAMGAPAPPCNPPSMFLTNLLLLCNLALQIRSHRMGGLGNR